MSNVTKKEDNRVKDYISDVERQMAFLRDTGQAQSLGYLTAELLIEILRELRNQRG